MPALHSVPQFAWLPELYSLIDEEALTRLCAVAGGETIRIPTLDELEASINALQWYYDVYLVHRKQPSEIPDTVKVLVKCICDVYESSGEVDA